MRRLSILRHAKAEQGDGLEDSARAINSRGEKDAHALGKFLKSEAILPELIICSTAKRTRQTLAQLNVTIPTQLSKRAYLASPGELIGLVHEADDAVRHILLIGHNPGMHNLVIGLTQTYEHAEDEELLALKFPTCAYASITFPAKRWKDIIPQMGTLDLLAIGKNL